MQDSLPNLIGAAYTTGPVLGKTGNSEIIPPVSSMVSDFLRKQVWFLNNIFALAS